jgi:hypothetical protein
MTKEELMNISKAAWGEQWRRPAARAIGRDERMIRFYMAGRNKIPDALAEKLRDAVNIGPAGEIVRALLHNKFPQAVAHNIARDAVVRLQKAGLLVSKAMIDAAAVRAGNP